MRGQAKSEERREQTAFELDQAWVPIEMALGQQNGLKVIDLYVASEKKLRSALHWRIVDWMNDRYALPPTDRFPFKDDQGLMRLIYLTYEKLPMPDFAVDMLPDLFEKHALYWKKFPLKNLPDRPELPLDNVGKA